MDNELQNMLKDLALDQLMKSPIGGKLQQASEMIQAVQENMFALYEKQDELGMTGIKAASILVFNILQKISQGKKTSEFSSEDWKNIADSISNRAICSDDQYYSAFVFSLYENYIRGSAGLIKKIIPKQTADAITALADELCEKAAELQSGNISEGTYIEDCLWISLEAMIKMIASTAILSGDSRMEEFAQALASYAFEYGRYKLYSRELAIVNQFIASQYQLDEDLAQKYSAYMEDLEKETAQFYVLIDNAFAPDFRNALLKSVLLAKASGVSEEEILSSVEDIDSFFMD